MTLSILIILTLLVLASVLAAERHFSLYRVLRARARAQRAFEVLEIGRYVEQEVLQAALEAEVTRRQAEKQTTYKPRPPPGHSLF